MIYDVYAGGFHAVEAQLDVDFSKKERYSLIMSAHTRGFLGSVAPWNGTFESHGWVLEGNDYRPETHKSTATWRDEIETKEYKYNKDRSFKGLLITDHDRPTYKKEVADELTQGTTDILTATLLAMRAISNGNDCQGTSEVFDGKRRFKLKFVHKEYETLTASRYNIYEGESTKCTVEVEPLSGAWHKKPRGWLSIQEQGRDKGMMPTVWMAKMNKDGPAVPIKILVKTQYGALYMHLTEYRNGDNVQIAQNRIED